MSEYSVLIGGKAGEGINTAGLSIAGLFSRLGYRTYMYFDYPSLIRGGHNFAIIRASEKAVRAHRTPVDVLLAFDQKSIDSHRDRIHDGTTIIYDASVVVRGETATVSRSTRSSRRRGRLRSQKILRCSALSPAWQALNR
ncbi:MAG: 2-oxoacid:acceptor oxidoreductase family protein [Methanoculleus sp.]